MSGGTVDAGRPKMCVACAAAVYRDNPSEVAAADGAISALVTACEMGAEIVRDALCPVHRRRFVESKRTMEQVIREKRMS